MTKSALLAAAVALSACSTVVVEAPGAASSRVTGATHAATTGGSYTVVKGDTLSAISKRQYGDANKYMRIFEANKPMLSDPNKIYPGQVLRIPPAA